MGGVSHLNVILFILLIVLIYYLSQSSTRQKTADCAVRDQFICCREVSLFMNDANKTSCYQRVAEDIHISNMCFIKKVTRMCFIKKVTRSDRVEGKEKIFKVVSFRRVYFIEQGVVFIYRSLLFALQRTSPLLVMSP